MCWIAHAVPHNPYPLLEGYRTEMHLQWFQHTGRLPSLLRPAGLITSKRKEHSKHWQHFHGNNRAHSIGCQHPPARQTFVWTHWKSGCVSPASRAYQRTASRTVCWACDFSMTNFLIWYCTGLTMRYIHVLKGNLQGMEQPQERSRAWNTGEHPVMTWALLPLLSIPNPATALTARNRSVHPGCLPTPARRSGVPETWPCTGLLSALQGVVRRAGVQTQHSGPHFMKGKAAHALFSRTGIHFFLLQFSFLNFSMFPKARKGGLER